MPDTPEQLVCFSQKENKGPEATPKAAGQTTQNQ